MNTMWSKVVEKLLSREWLLVVLCSAALILGKIDMVTYQTMLVCGIGALYGKKQLDKSIPK